MEVAAGGESGWIARDLRGRIPMRLDWIRRRSKTLLCLLLIPPASWLALVFLAPTGWMVHCFRSHMQSASGRTVRLAGASGCILGGIELTGLEIGAQGNLDDPILTAGSVKIDIGLWQVLKGSLEPTHIRVERGRLRILRRFDGALELADLLPPRPKAAAPNHAYERAPLVVEFHDCELMLIDQVTKSRIEIKGLAGEAVRDGRRFVVNQMNGTLNGGPIRLAAQLDRSSAPSRADVRLRADEVAVDDGLAALRYIAPVLSGASLHLKGRLQADLYLAARGDDHESLLKSLEGHGSVTLSPIDLDGADLVAELARLGEAPRQGRLASIHSEFIVKDQHITTEHATLTIGRIPLILAGSTNLDGSIDYRMRIDGVDGRLSTRARRLLDDLNLDLGDVTTLSLKGTVDNMVVEAGGVAVRNTRGKAVLAPDDQEKLKRIGRQLRDRLIR